MAFQHKINRGSCFRNEYKEEGDNRPDFTGSGKMMMPGMDKAVEVRIAMWMNPPEDGKKGYFSVQFSEPKKKNEGEAPQPMPENFDEDIPF